jgi:hypothetical protein
MTDFKPTHRTRAGVEVEAGLDGACIRVKMTNALPARTYGVLLYEDEFETLFERIPVEKTVTITLKLAKRLAGAPLDCEDTFALREKIAEAEATEEADF